MHDCCSALPSTSYFPAMCCAAAHLWTLLNGALVWPDSSPLLHFLSSLPTQPSGCHRKAVKTFHSFCMAALFPSALPNNSNIFIAQHASRISCAVYIFYPLRHLFINRLFPPTRCMSKLGFLSSRHNMFCLC